MATATASSASATPPGAPAGPSSIPTLTPAQTAQLLNRLKASASAEARMAGEIEAANTRIQLLESELARRASLDDVASGRTAGGGGSGGSNASPGPSDGTALRAAIEAEALAAAKDREARLLSQIALLEAEIADTRAKSAALGPGSGLTSTGAAGGGGGGSGIVQQVPPPMLAQSSAGAAWGYGASQPVGAAGDTGYGRVDASSGSGTPAGGGVPEVGTLDVWNSFSKGDTANTPPFSKYGGGTPVSGYTPAATSSSSAAAADREARAALQQSLADAQAMINDLRHKLKAAKSELDTARVAHADLEHTCAGLQAEMRAKDTDALKLQQRVVDSETRCEALTKRVLHLDAELESAHTQIEGLRGDVALGAGRAADLTAQLRQTMDTLTATQQRVDDLTGQLESASRSISNMQSEVATTMSQMRTVSQHLTAVRDKYRNAKTALRISRSELASARRDKASLIKRGACSTHAIVQNDILPLEALDLLGRNWIPMLPPTVTLRNFSMMHLRQLQDCAEYSIQGDPCASGKLAGGLMPINVKSTGDMTSCNSLVFKIMRHGALFAMKALLPVLQAVADENQLLAKHAQEYGIQLMCSHPSIARIRHTFVGPSMLAIAWLPEGWQHSGAAFSRTTTYIITDFMQPLDLYLQKQKTTHPAPPFGLPTTWHILAVLQLTEAVHHLRTLHISHRDMKLDNVFVASNGRLVINDFGEAMMTVMLDGGDMAPSLASLTGGGAPFLKAPELLHYQRAIENPAAFPGVRIPPTVRQVYEKVDLWAVGCSAFQLLRAADDQTFPSNAAMFSDEQIPELPDCYMPQFRAIVKRMLVSDPARRLDTAQAKLLLQLALWGPSAATQIPNLQFAAEWLRTARNECLMRERERERDAERKDEGKVDEPPAGGIGSPAAGGGAGGAAGGGRVATNADFPPPNVNIMEVREEPAMSTSADSDDEDSGAGQVPADEFPTGSDFLFQPSNLEEQMRREFLFRTTPQQLLQGLIEFRHLTD